MNATLFVALLVVAVPIKPPPDKPTGPAPQVAVVTVRDNGKPALLVQTTKYVPVRRSMTIKVGDKQETREYTAYDAVTEQRFVEVDGEKLQVYKTDGKKVDAKDVKALFKGQTPVLLSADGKPVDPFYLRLTKEDTLILVGQPAPVTPSGPSTPDVTPTPGDPPVPLTPPPPPPPPPKP